MQFDRNTYLDIKNAEDIDIHIDFNYSNMLQYYMQVFLCAYNFVLYTFELLLDAQMLILIPIFITTTQKQVYLSEWNQLVE